LAGTNISAGYLVCPAAPDRKDLNDFLGGWGAGAGYYEGVGVSAVANSAGTAVNIGAGIGGQVLASVLSPGNSGGYLMLFQVIKKHAAFWVVGLTFVLIGFLSVIKGMDKTEGVSFRELNDEMAKIPQLKEAIFIRRHQTDRFGSALISDKFSIYSSLGMVEKYDEWLASNGWVL